jgi:putative nucleotidyltransferase with HDIG domain
MNYSQTGTDGTRGYTPIGGAIQGHRARLPVTRSALGVLGRVGPYAAILACTAVVLLASLIAAGYRVEHLWIVVALAVIAAIAERGSVSLSSTIEASISLVPMVFAAVLFGPLAAALVGAASMVSDFRTPYLRWLVYTSSRAITGVVTGFTTITIADGRTGDFEAVALATAAGAIVAEVMDAGFATMTLRLRRGTSPWESARTLLPVVATSVALYTPVVAVLAYAYREHSSWTLPLFFIPALAAQHLFVLLQRQRHLTDDLVNANAQLERAGLSFATALVTTLDARDRHTAGHSAAVAVYSRDIATRLGLSREKQQLAHMAGLVHDIGKIGLAAGLLEKTGPLTLDERRQMEAHSEIGERILAKVADYAEVARIVRHHHERFDGNGYPDRLRGEAIPLLSRVISVADAYNAMTSDRPYRDAMPSRVARLRLAQAVEGQFDTTVVAAFEAVLAGSSESYRSGLGPDFTLAAQDLYSSDRAAEAA